LPLGSKALTNRDHGNTEEPAGGTGGGRRKGRKADPSAQKAGLVMTPLLALTVREEESAQPGAAHAVAPRDAGLKPGATLKANAGCRPAADGCRQVSLDSGFAEE